MPFQHGNATGLRRAYIRTCPSVLRGIECEFNHPSYTVYRKLVTVVPPTTHMPVKQPRNTKQAKKHQVKAVRETMTFS